VADALTADQIAALAQRERAGCNPGMLLCEARELAAHNRTCTQRCHPFGRIL
jgi:hypothetical protein